MSSISKIAIAVVVVTLGLVAGGGSAAHAYPQFQLSRDQTCTGCHLTPSGGGLLSENGLNTAEGIAQFGKSPGFLYDAWKPPAWLVLGGDIRVAGGYFRTPFQSLGAFPMQGELYARAIVTPGLALHVTGGIRPSEQGNEAATHAWSREHYVQWQLEPDESTGLYVRVGRFMPVFGLRFIEHPLYTRRFGGTPLFSETYAAAIEYIDPKYEVHATGFVRDPLIDAVAHDSGGALYGEYRVTDKFSVGAETMATASKDDKKYRYGVTSKLYIAPAELLLSGEAILTHQSIERSGSVNSVAAYVMASRFITDWFLLDLGAGHYDENVKIKLLDRDCADLNLHWFVDSHLEVLLTSRVELIGLGKGGPFGAYSLLQVHYRL